MKTVTSNQRTHTNDSPVITITGKHLHDIRVALDHDGNIYRKLLATEKTAEILPADVTLSESTAAMIENYNEAHEYHDTAINKKDVIQQWKISNLHTIRQAPLHEMDVALYYAAYDAIKHMNNAAAKNVNLHKLAATVRDMAGQIALLKAERKADVLVVSKGYTFKQAVAYVLAGKRLEYTFSRLFAGETLHPNTRTVGKWARSSNGMIKIQKVLDKAAIKYVIGNDAPRGGFTGAWIKLK